MKELKGHERGSLFNFLSLQVFLLGLDYEGDVQDGADLETIPHKGTQALLGDSQMSIGRCCVQCNTGTEQTRRGS